MERPKGDPPMGTGAARRFRVPGEHGAWWAFGTTWAGAFALAWIRHADRGACLGAAAALAAGFLAQDWVLGLVAGALGRGAPGAWGASTGWLLVAVAAAGAALTGVRAGAPLGWSALWCALALGALGGLALRAVVPGRGRRSLAATAALLSAPALVFGCLAFGFTPRALEAWAWGLVFYPAATLAAQAFVRGFPERARWAGPALVASLGLAAAALRAPLAALLLSADAAFLWVSIRRRWRRRPQGLPEPAAVRRFGWYQAGFSVALTAVWVMVFGGVRVPGT